MSAVIDRTLSGDLTTIPLVRKEHIISYLEALKVCGTDYVEIGRCMLLALGSEDFSRKYIFRLESEEDMLFCRDHKFAYVSVPYRLARLYPELSENQSVLAEVQADEYSAQAVLLQLKASGMLKYVSVIRITGFFSTNAERMKSLVKWFHENFVQSIDICPLNRSLGGCVSALDANFAGADAITLSFGRDERYTSLESYYIETHILNRTFMPKDIIAGICRASTAYMNLFGSLPCGLEQLDDLAGRLRTPVCNPELGVIYRTFAVNKREEKKPRESVVKRRIESMELDSEIEKAVLEAVLKAGLITL